MFARKQVESGAHVKKSEKVEIRVSLDEKETLTRLAKFEGTSVSELVRNLVRKYVAINTHSTHQKPSFALSAGLVLGGILIGALVVVTQLPRDQSGFYFVEGTIEDSAFGFAFSPTTDKSHVLTLGQGERLSQPYRVSVAPKNSKSLFVQVCRIDQNECYPTADWTVELGPSMPSVFQSVGPNDEYIFMSVQKMAS